MDEQALADALNNSVIAWACIDALTFEPMREDCPLRNVKNCTITPHVAWAPRETRIRLLEKVAENIRSWKNGKPINIVSD